MDTNKENVQPPSYPSKARGFFSSKTRTYSRSSNHNSRTYKHLYSRLNTQNHKQRPPYSPSNHNRHGVPHGHSCGNVQQTIQFNPSLTTQNRMVISKSANIMDIDEKQRSQNHLNQLLTTSIVTACGFQFILNIDRGVRGTLYITIKGSVDDDKNYQIWRKVHGKDRKEIKLSPSWLYRQHQDVAKGILIRLFKMKKTELMNVSKSDIVSLCYGKLKMTKANNKLKEKQLMMFTEAEIKIILTKLNKIEEIYELSTEIFNFYASQELYLDDEQFMDILDDVMCHELYKEAVSDIYKKLMTILINSRTAKKFDIAFAAFHRERIKCVEVQKLIVVFSKLNENKLNTYSVPILHYTSLFVYSMKKIFLKHLTSIVYSLFESNNVELKIDNTISNEQAASYGGSALCSCFRMAYSRRLRKETREIFIYLQKQLCCKDDEIKYIPTELQYENQGGMYMLSPSLYQLCKRILSAILTVLNRNILLPSHKLEDFQKLIKKQINNQQNIENFKRIYSNEDLEKHNEYISKIHSRLIRFMCGKLIYSTIKQQNWSEVGLGLRDQFNFGHMAMMKKRKKKTATDSNILNLI